jgi:drug/metabolite transporter (DMT)-like permease
LERCGEWPLLAVRFALAAVVLTPFVVRRWPELRHSLGAGLLLGVVMGTAFGAQTIGLASIGPSRSAFLTALYVVFTPLCEWVVTRHRPTGRMWVAVLLAFLGSGLITGTGFDDTELRAGDLWTILCALLFAWHMAILAWGLARFRSLALLWWQIFTCAALGAIGCLWSRPIRFDNSATLWALLMFLGLIATVVALGLQNYGQARTSATRAAVLFATEPVWALVFSVWLGDRMQGQELIGAAIVLLALLLASLPGQPSLASNSSATRPS